MYSHSDPECTVWCDCMMNELNDVCAHPGVLTDDMKKKEEAAKGWYPRLEKVWKCIEDKMTECNWTYSAGNSVGPSDMYLFAYYYRFCINPDKDEKTCYMLYTMYDDIFKQCPRIMNAMSEIAKHPNMVNYMKNKQTSGSF